MVNVGAMIGALLGGPLADRLGRKGAIMSSTLPWIASWFITGFAQQFGLLVSSRWYAVRISNYEGFHGNASVDACFCVFELALTLRNQL